MKNLARSVLLVGVLGAGMQLVGCGTSGSARSDAHVFTLMNDSVASVDVELPTLPGHAGVTVEPGGSYTTPLGGVERLDEQGLRVVILPMDAESGAVGRPIQAQLKARPYAMRVFGTASALRWSPVTPAAPDRSPGLVAPPPRDPSSGIQGSR